MSINDGKCNFCGNKEPGIIHVKGIQDVHICELCVDEAVSMLESKTSQLDTQEKPHLTPSIIKTYLDQSVVGQDKAKRLLSIAVYNHYKRINNKSKTIIQKSNILLIGPSGSGKTYLVQNIAKLLKLPLAIADASSITKAGYIGDDSQGILSRLLMEAKGDIPLAERGIIFLDEFDKLARAGSSDGKRDISGDVQWELLKMIEGDKVFINPEGSKKGGGAKEVMIDTSSILFIFGGAFSNMEEQKYSKSIGIGTLDPEKDAKISHNDIIKYGFIPEIIGRIPVLAQLNSLTKEDMRHILCDTKNNLIDQYSQLLKIDGINLKFSDEFIDKAVDSAIKNVTGARSLRGVMEHSLEDIMFDAPDMVERDLIVTGEDFKE